MLYCSGEEKELLSVNPVPVCPFNRVFIVVVQCYLIGADVNGFETMTATQLPTYLHIHTHCPTPTPGKTKTFEPPPSKKKKGYGFVSFKDPNDFMKALREMNGKYIGNRPVKLRKSTWKDRDAGVVKKKERKKKSQGHLGGDISLYSSKGVPTFAHV